ncbi:hypothetical protein [Sphingobacterium yanglingense]|uniref:Uncharacterized protein n=1 Tax=Sphingobacterium yanglingense TaxID=1437280 RepID=A0A4R6WKK6_9SPHI|nr:hypothetical protein [Sphingobacterium yanglingense]TDQ76331.1 hypothetical protein CLV99_2918 [Sphingobacterium yanglingense]
MSTSNKSPLKKAFLKGFGLILFLIIAFFCFEFFRRQIGGFAGSYPFAEVWQIAGSIEDTERKLIKLHEIEPDLFFENDSLSFKNDPTKYWKKVDFYYKDRQEIVHALIRDDGNNTDIYLVSFVDTVTGDLRLMNKDFGFFANLREMKDFENKVLDKINAIK